MTLQIRWKDDKEFCFVTLYTELFKSTRTTCIVFTFVDSEAGNPHINGLSEILMPLFISFFHPLHFFPCSLCSGDVHVNDSVLREGFFFSCCCEEKMRHCPAFWVMCNIPLLSPLSQLVLKSLQFCHRRLSKQEPFFPDKFVFFVGK